MGLAEWEWDASPRCADDDDGEGESASHLKRRKLFSLNTDDASSPSALQACTPQLSFGTSQQQMLAAYNFFFGAPANSDLLAQYTGEHAATYTFPDAYAGRCQQLRDAINNLVEHNVDCWMTRTILPFHRVEGATRIKWDQIDFGVAPMAQTAYGGTSRLLTSTSRTRSASVVRRGLAFQVEHDFFCTSVGQKHFSDQLKGIACCVQETCNHDGLWTLLNCSNYDFQYDMGRRLIDRFYVKKAMGYEITSYAICQKQGRGIDTAVEMAKERMSRYGVSPDSIIVPPRLALYVTTAPEARIRYDSGGPQAVAEHRRGSQGFLSNRFRGMDVYQSRSFPSGDRGESVQLLERQTQVGEYYVMKTRGSRDWRASPGVPSNRVDRDRLLRSGDIAVYDEERDTLVDLSILDAVDASGFHELSEDPDTEAHEWRKEFINALPCDDYDDDDRDGYGHPGCDESHADAGDPDASGNKKATAVAFTDADKLGLALLSGSGVSPEPASFSPGQSRSQLHRMLWISDGGLIPAGMGKDGTMIPGGRNPTGLTPDKVEYRSVIDCLGIARDRVTAFIAASKSAAASAGEKGGAANSINALTKAMSFAVQYEGRLAEEFKLIKRSILEFVGPMSNIATSMLAHKILTVGPAARDTIAVQQLKHTLAIVAMCPRRLVAKVLEACDASFEALRADMKSARAKCRMDVGKLQRKDNVTNEELDSIMNASLSADPEVIKALLSPMVSYVDKLKGAFSRAYHDLTGSIDATGVAFADKDAARTAAAGLLVGPRLEPRYEMVRHLGRAIAQTCAAEEFMVKTHGPQIGGEGGQTDPTATRLSDVAEHSYGISAWLAALPWLLNLHVGQCAVSSSVPEDADLIYGSTAALTMSLALGRRLETYAVRKLGTLDWKATLLEPGTSDTSGTGAVAFVPVVWNRAILRDTLLAGRNLPIEVIVMRPFIEHKMLSALLTVAGSDTGNTLLGPSDMQLSANTSVKMIDGHYTGHSKAVVTKPQNVFVLRNILANGYVAGNNCAFFGSHVTDRSSRMGNPQSFVTTDTIKKSVNQRLGIDRRPSRTPPHQQRSNRPCSLLAFVVPIGSEDRLQERAFPFSPRTVPFDPAPVDMTSLSPDVVPGGGSIFQPYLKRYGLTSLLSSCDSEYVRNNSFFSSGAVLNGYAFQGPYRSYDARSGRCSALHPGQGHFGPDAVTGDASWRAGDTIGVSEARGSTMPNLLNGGVGILADGGCATSLQA